jgi:hypothetical protein
MYIDKFNELGNYLQQIFPNATVIGNHDKIEYLGCFDVYLRGVGPLLDEDGKYFLFRKKNENRFPTNEEVSDKLVALSMLYGSSTNISQAQHQYKRAYTETQKSNVDKHVYPAVLSEEGEVAKNGRHVTHV